MNEYIADITLDLDCRKTSPKICAGQYDKGRKIRIHITANGADYSASGATAVIKGRRHDKSYFSEECVVDNSGNVILTLSEDILAVCGFAYAKIVLSGSSKVYSTQVFIIDVDNGLEGPITDPANLSILNTILDRLRSTVEFVSVSSFNTATEPAKFYLVSTNDNDYIVLVVKGDETIVQYRFSCYVNGGEFAELKYRKGQIDGSTITWGLWEDIIDLSGYVENTLTIAGNALRGNISANTLRNSLAQDSIIKNTTTGHKGVFGTLQDGSPVYNSTGQASGWVELARKDSIPDVSDKVDKTQKIADIPLDDDIDKWVLGRKITPTNLGTGVNGYKGQYGLDRNDKPCVNLTAADGWEELALASAIPDVSGKENNSNKVTSLSSSSTNAQYPSAKCVYDLIGNVETLLSQV